MGHYGKTQAQEGFTSSIFGRFAANCVAVSASLTVQTFEIGAKAGIETARVASQSLGKVLKPLAFVAPLQDVAQDEAVEQDQTIIVEIQSAEQNLAIVEPNQHSWIETIASAGASSIDSLAALAAQGIRTVTGSGPGQVALDVVLRGARSMPGAKTREIFDSEEKDAFVGVAIRSGTAALRAAFTSAEAALRFGFRDTRKIRQTIEASLEQMHLLGNSDEIAVFLPLAHPELKARARKILDRTPQGFLQALAPPPGERHSDHTMLVKAFFKEAHHLGFSAVAYPQFAALGGYKVSELVLNDKLSFVEIEAFLEGRELASG